LFDGRRFVFSRTFNSFGAALDAAGQICQMPVFVIHPARAARANNRIRHDTSRSQPMSVLLRLSA